MRRKFYAALPCSLPNLLLILEWCSWLFSHYPILFAIFLHAYLGMMYYFFFSLFKVWCVICLVHSKNGCCCIIYGKKKLKQLGCFSSFFFFKLIIFKYASSSIVIYTHTWLQSIEELTPIGATIFGLIKNNLTAIRQNFLLIIYPIIWSPVNYIPNPIRSSKSNALMDGSCGFMMKKLKLSGDLIFEARKNGGSTCSCFGGHVFTPPITRESSAIIYLNNK